MVDCKENLWSRNWLWCHVTGDKEHPSWLGAIELWGWGLAGEDWGPKEVEEGSSWV